MHHLAALRREDVCSDGQEEQRVEQCSRADAHLPGKAVQKKRKERRRLVVRRGQAVKKVSGHCTQHNTQAAGQAVNREHTQGAS